VHDHLHHERSGIISAGFPSPCGKWLKQLKEFGFERPPDRSPDKLLSITHSYLAVPSTRRLSLTLN
jgi:hypothetical protein